MADEGESHRKFRIVLWCLFRFHFVTVRHRSSLVICGHAPKQKSPQDLGFGVQVVVVRFFGTRLGCVCWVLGWVPGRDQRVLRAEKQNKVERTCSETLILPLAS